MIMVSNSECMIILFHKADSILNACCCSNNYSMRFFYIATQCIICTGLFLLPISRDKASAHISNAIVIFAV